MSRQLGRYTLLRRLASGGMGEVYLAEIRGAANFKRQVAIKRILPHLAGDAAFLHKFIDEAHLMVQLHHGNIVPVQELNDEDGELYLVMEYLPGRDLKAVIRALRQQQRRMPVDLASWLISEVCAGLDYAHRKSDPSGQPLSIVHRDVSPSNILLGAGGEVKLTDFGIASARGGLHQSITGSLQGKFVYMSPEQAEGRPLDARSDLFSTGLVLYELLCGFRPFEAVGETEILRRVRQTEIDPPHQHAKLSSDLEALLLKALSRDPKKRFETAAEMQRALLRDLSKRESIADAAKLTEFLKDLFPEGVIPVAGPVSLSMDEALLLQLGGLTPSAEFLETRTGSNPALARTTTPQPVVNLQSGSFSRPNGLFQASQSGSFPHPSGSFSSSLPLADPQLPSAPERSRLFIALWIALGALSMAALFSLWSSPKAEIYPKVEPPSIKELRFSLRQNGKYIRFQPGAQLSLGGHFICASAPQFHEVCRLFSLKEGENHPLFKLKAKTILNPKILPPVEGAQVFLDSNRFPSAMPYEIPKNRSRIRVQVRAEGQLVEPESGYSLNVKPGLNEPLFRLTPLQPLEPLKALDMGVKEVDAGFEPRDAAAEARLRDVKKRARRRTLIRLKPAENQKPRAHCRGQDFGFLPLLLDTSRGPIRCRFEAPGWLPSRRNFKAGERGELKIQLYKPGELYIRATGAAEIFLEGEKIGTGYVKSYPLAPGEYEISARRGAREIRKRVQVKAGRVYRLDLREKRREP